jgi:hypothetical protein
MARYNTVTSSSSISAGITLTTPGQGSFTEITTGGVTVQLPNPALYAGSNQVFYNIAGTSATLSTVTNGGTIQGPGVANTNSLTLNTNGALTLYSDGTYWIQTNAAGQPMAVSTLSASGQITSTLASGTAPFVVASTTNVANLNASSLNGATFAAPGTIGSTTASGATFTSIAGTSLTITAGSTSVAAFSATGITNSPISGSTGSFTTLGANSQVSFTANTSSSTTGTGTIVVTGGVGVSGQVTCATIVETSSIAFKENVQPLAGALETVMQLFGVTYDRKDNNDHESGLIAEEVYKIAPDLVSLDPVTGKPYGIKYTKLGAYFVEAIKTLKSEIDKLKGNK